MRRLQWEGLRDKIPNEVFLEPDNVRSERAAGRGPKRCARLPGDHRGTPVAFRRVGGSGGCASPPSKDHGGADVGNDALGDWQYLQRIAKFVEAWHRAVLGYTAPVPAEDRSCH